MTINGRVVNGCYLKLLTVDIAKRDLSEWASDLVV